jgi:hypothetical protein
MFIKTSARGGIELEDRDNFHAFKVLVDGSRDQIEDVRRALAGMAALADADTAWVSMDSLRNWPDVAHDMNWQQSFTAMIEKARPHGWIDDQRRAIKAHVEWAA